MRARTEASKKRFLENLWRVQALYRTRNGGSVALVSKEQEVEARGGKVQIARTYWNVYQRTMFLKETRKVGFSRVAPNNKANKYYQSKIVLHIDSEGNADPLPFGANKMIAPFVIVRVQPMAGELCRYRVTSSDPDDDPEEDIVQTARVPGRVVHTSAFVAISIFLTILKVNLNSCSSSIRSLQIQNECYLSPRYSISRSTVTRAHLWPGCHLSQPFRRTSGFVQGRPLW